MPDQTLYTVPEAAAKLRVSRQAVYKWIEQGNIQAVILPNGQYRITQETLDYLIENVIPVEQRRLIR